MNETFFGETSEPERKPQLKVLWPPRAVNQIEWSLMIAMGEELSLVEWRTPMIFIEDDEFANADQYAELYGEELTAHEAVALRNTIYGEIAERYRRQIVIARECGERATMDDYLIGCAAEGIKPILQGVSK